MPSPNYEEYEKSLDTIRDGVMRDYFVGIVNINQHQLNVSRTYLWVSAALIGVYTAAFDRYGSYITSQIYSLSFGLLSGALVAVGFGLCLYAIPIRKGYRSIPQRGWGEFSREAYDLLRHSRPNSHAVFLTSFINKMDLAYAHNMRSNRGRARLLRGTSWVLIGSFSSACIAAAIAASFYAVNNS